MSKLQDGFVYRPWIDGWRAIAVILVILNHYFGFLPVGFIGVDIFFVISGFLVGGIIYQQITTRQFSLSNFYLKRIHRIIPAQLFMIGWVFVALRVFSFPDEIIERYTKEVSYSVISISNYFYWNAVGYFDIEGTRKFLLHTWSLAAEEQFYLFFPIFLILLAKCKKRLGILFFCTLLIFSFGSNLCPFDLASKFYLLPFRFWEFGLGFCIYYVAEKKLVCFPGLKWIAIVAFVLLAALQVNPFHFSESWLIIASTLFFGILFFALETGNITFLTSLLSCAPIRYIGNISYSLYLAHWPVIVIMRLRFPAKTPSVINFLLYAGITLLLALVSYYLIEKRFRLTKDSETKRKPIISALSILLFMVGTASFIAIKKPYSVINTVAFNVQKYPLPNCGELIVESSIINNSLPTLIIWGDSHAGMLTFRENSYSSSYNIYKVYSTGCPPFFNTRVITECNCDDPGKIFAAWKIIKQLKPAYVVLASRFSIYINGLRINNVLRKGNHFISSDSTKNGSTLAGRKKAFAYGLRSTVDSLLHINTKVMIMKQVPDFANFHNPESLVAGGVYSVLPGVLFRPLADADSIINTFQLVPQVRIFDPRDFFKGDRGFLIFDQASNRLLYKDDSHLSTTGAMRITTPLLKEIKNWK